MAENIANTIARQLFAMAAKRRDKDLVESMREERYRRTFSDEYTFSRKSRARLDRVDPSQKAQWEMLAARK